MACSYPMFRIPGEALLHHPLFNVYQNRLYNNGVIIQRPEYESLKKIYPLLADQIDQIPCGKCIQCRLSYSRDWANRCMMELKTSTNAAFITLTYDTEHLHFNPYVDVETGEIGYRPMLWPADLRNFMKRLRFWCSEQPGNGEMTQRFYACGEYGEITQRPHYHLILYNLPPEFYENSHVFTNGVCAPYWTCSPLEKLWPDGLSVYGDVSWECCAYVARYVMKKQKGKSRQAQIAAQAQFFPDHPWIDEFTRMSRMPGLGRAYYDEHKDEIYATDEIFVPRNGSVQPARPCKYYDRLFDVEREGDMLLIKKRRKDQAQQLELTLEDKTDLSLPDYLELKEQSKQDQAKRLIRPDI